MTNRAPKRPHGLPTSVKGYEQPGVFLGWCDKGLDGVDGKMMANVLDTLMHDRGARHLILDRGGYARAEGSGRLSSLRTMLVRAFLSTKAEWFWGVDTDMSFDFDALRKLLESADPVHAPIMGGLCFAARAGQLSRPTLYVMRSREEDEAAVPTTLTEWPRDQVIQVDATGAAFFVVHRSVYEEMEKRYGGPYPWYADTWIGDFEVGEDITFCLRARQMGYPVCVNTAVKVGHRKVYEYDLAEYERNALPTWRANIQANAEAQLAAAQEEAAS